MSKPVNSELALKAIDGWVSNAYQADDLIRKIEAYANGGPPPAEDDTCEDDIVPLGFASTNMKKEMAPLIDALMQKPGIIDMQLVTPAIQDGTRTQQIQFQVNRVVNEMVMARLRPVLTNLAGRSTVAGLGYLAWTSPNDWLPKSVRLLHPPEAGIDLLDSEWREWAFKGRISLRTIEERIKSSSPNKHGWNYKGLVRLKEWILADEASKKRNGTGSDVAAWMQKYDRELWSAVDISEARFCEPVDVYWYYRKNGKITKNHPLYEGHEEVDLYCISRFGGAAKVHQTVQNDITYKNLAVDYPNTGKNAYKKMISEVTAFDREEDPEDAQERLIFYSPGLFKSIEECLVFHNDDASVSGDQLLSEVRGHGKTAMPKIAVLEGMLNNLIAGIGFASMPTWSVGDGVPQEYLNQLQRGGLRAGQAFPMAVQPMQKQNSMVGIGAAVQAIGLMDSGISADSSANQTGVFGSTNAEFASQALADQNNRSQAMSRRGENWLMTLDKVAARVGRTICRHWPKMRESFPAYHDANRMRKILKTRYSVHEDEWDEERWDFQARRLNGGLMRDQAVAVNGELLQLIGPHMPSLIPLFCKEILRARVGDVVAEQYTQPREEQKLSQQKAAREAVAQSYVMGSPSPVEPMDDPIIHSGVASDLAGKRIQSAQGLGMVMPGEVVGIMAVLQYAASHIMRLPKQLAEQAMERIEAMAAAIQSVPVQQPPQEGAMTEKEQAEIAIKSANQQRLQTDTAAKWQDKSVKQLMDLRKMANSERQLEATQKTLAVQRAKGNLELQRDLLEMNEQQPV